MELRRSATDRSPPRPERVSFSRQTLNATLAETLRDGLTRGTSDPDGGRRLSFSRYHDVYGPEVRSRLPELLPAQRPAQEQVEAHVRALKERVRPLVKQGADDAINALQNRWGVSARLCARVGAMAKEDFYATFWPVLRDNVAAQVNATGAYDRSIVTPVRQWVTNQVYLRLGELQSQAEDAAGAGEPAPADPRT